MGALIQTTEELSNFLRQLDTTRPIAADVETYKSRPSLTGSVLLGLALSGYERNSNTIKSGYLVFNHYDKLAKYFKQGLGPAVQLVSFLNNSTLVGWNVPFDKMWIDSRLGVNTKWKADGRILWHLQNNDPSIRGFGLKLAQKKLLGWEESNDKALDENVAMYGGKLANGDHYLADLDLISRYACLDTESTLKAYEVLKPFVDKHSYWGFASEILEYALLLNDASQQGLPVDRPALMHAAALYKQKREEAEESINKTCADEIRGMEDAWKMIKLARYKTVRGRVNFLEKQRLQKRFNPASGLQRAKLIHDVLAFPVKETTPTGLPKTDRANLASVKHDVAKSLVEFSEYKKIYEATQTYLGAIDETDGRIHTNYDICGTVSGRLSGFKPSVLNMPFSESEVMRAFVPSDGLIGIHADLAAIEPCVLAHYSEDPTLLKVYKDGLGDIYLDLALDIFPENQELKSEYNPYGPVSSEIKTRFKDLRSLCKIIHLAVSYTGTHVTVAKNLSKAGFPTEKGKAMQLVSRYWKKFERVKAFNHRLQEVYEDRGFIRNLTGRVLLVPEIYKKDLMNRLVQSGAHDILRLWVMEIVSEFTTRRIHWQHWLPDLHDSTTFMVKPEHAAAAQEAYLVALERVSKKVNLSVPLKCEMKLMKTLAGVKENGA